METSKEANEKGYALREIRKFAVIIKDIAEYAKQDLERDKEQLAQSRKNVSLLKDRLNIYEAYLNTVGVIPFFSI